MTPYGTAVATRYGAASAGARQARYVGDTVQTASPARLLTMLYDRLVLDLERAEQALETGDRSAVNRELQHAQDIVLELRCSLVTDAWEGGPALASLYAFLLDRLVDANVRADVALVRTCRDLVEPLRDAWREASTAGERAAGPVEALA